MDFSLTMIPVLNGPRAENHDTNFRENPCPPQLGGIMDFSTVMIPVLNSPRAENHDTNFRENPCPPELGGIMDFSQNAFRSGCLKLV